MAQIRFYFGEHVPKAVYVALQRRGVDALTAQAAGRAGLPDDDQLAFALHEERVMVPLDSDYIALAAKGMLHSGIIYAKPGSRSVGELIRALMLIHDPIEPGDMKNHVEYI